MASTDHQLFASLRMSLAAARQQSDDGDHSEALRLLEPLRRHCLSIGVESAHLAWALCVALDGLGRHEEALEHATEAVRLDPLALPYRRSLELITLHLREALLQAPDHDASIPRMHRQLASRGAVDGDCHVALARWHLARGERHEAGALLEAITRLEPWRQEAWRLLQSTAVGSRAQS